MSNFRPAEFIVIALIKRIISSLKKTMSTVIYSKIPSFKILK